MKRFNDFITEMKITLKGKKSGGNVDGFFNDFFDSTQGHPFDDRTRLHGMVGVHLSLHDGNVHMHDITNFGETKQGHGTRTLHHLKSLADKHGVEISGTAKAYSSQDQHIRNTKKLVGWYKKHGFEVGKGNNDAGYPISYKGKKPE